MRRSEFFPGGGGGGGGLVVVRGIFLSFLGLGGGSVQKYVIKSKEI